MKQTARIIIINQMTGVIRKEHRNNEKHLRERLDSALVKRKQLNS
jgi:hypothetical protein